MAERIPSSEFGGNPGVAGIQPLPHVPTAAEQLRIDYMTRTTPAGDRVLDGSSWEGLLPLDEQTKLRQQAGDMDKGQVWEAMNGS